MEEDSHRQLGPPRKRQRTKHTNDTESIDGPLKDPIKRTTRACDQCRAQKRRCDSAHPCHPCTKASLDCNYGAPVRKRGFPTGYVRIIEGLWSLVFRAVPGSQETALQLLRNSQIEYDDEGKATLINGYFGAKGSARKVWVNSSLRHEIEKLALELEDEEKSGTNVARNLSKSALAEDEPMSSSGSNFAAWAITDDILRDEDSCRHKDSHVNSPLETSAPLEAHLKRPVSLPSDAWKLIDIYFKFNHSWFPIAPKHSIVRAMTELQEGVKCTSSQLAVLWAIFALASEQQHDYNEDGCSASDKYCHEAIEAIPGAPQDMELGHLHALVLLVVLKIARGHWESACLVVRSAVRAILELQHPSRSKQRQGTMEPMLNRIILAAFAMDTLLAARLGTIPQLRTRDICSFAQCDENEADEWEQWSTSISDRPSNDGHAISQKPIRALSTFKQYVRLLSILNDHMCDLRPLEYREVKRDLVRGKLRAWEAQLPKHCQYSAAVATEIELEVLPPVRNLRLTAEAISIFLDSAFDISAAGLTPQPPSFQIPPTPTYTTAGKGASAWRGMLHFHEYARQRAQSSRLQRPITRSDDRLMAYRSPSLNVAYPDLANNQTDHGILAQVTAIEPSPHSYPPDFQHAMDEGLFTNDISNMTMNQAPFSASFVLNELQDMDFSPENASVAPIDVSISQGGTSNSFAQDHIYETLDDGTSIESLLEELSAQQNVSWDEMETQCMYNLGFFDTGDPMR